MTSYTGGYGFVAIPDSDTINQCYQFAKEHFPADSGYILSPGYLPHITLYHTRIKDAPEAWLSEARNQLASILKGVEFNLKELMCFGEKFIFWNVDPNSPAYGQLKTAHVKALELAEYIDPDAPRRAEEEGITLTGLEKENSDKYNHPLVRELYLPHITLAWGERVAEAVANRNSEEWNMKIERIEFAEIGHPGVVQNVVQL